MNSRPGRFKTHLRTLPVQMILSFIGLVLLTAVASGLPAIWLLRNQLERQAWSQVNQGSQAVQALYTAMQNDLTNLATLTAQRPTLRRLLSQDEQAVLPDYLQTLRVGAELDLIVVCDLTQRVVSQSGAAVPDDVCQLGQPVSFRLITAEPGSNLWLLAAQPIESEEVGIGGQVIVGLMLDDNFARQIQSKIGLDHTLYANGRPVASSLPGGVYRSNRISLSPLAEAAGARRNSFSFNGHPYYAIQTPLAVGDIDLNRQADDFYAEMALAVSDIFAAQQRLIWTLSGSILIIAGFSSVLGILLARRISRPLARLTDAATALSRGDLSKPAAIETQVREIALVGWALEAARLDLKSTLSDLQREKAWTDQLLEAIVEGIVTIDHVGRIVFFSRGAERLTGWSREQALGRSCDEIFQPAETSEPFSRLLPPPGRRHKIGVTLSDGRQVMLAVTGAKMQPPGNGASRLVLVFRDVSEEEAVRRLVGLFLANIAHEFRTPLSALAASVELLLDQAADLTPAELQELLISLHLGVLGLQTLIDNLLESASIEAGRFHVSPRPSGLKEIMTEVAQTLQPLLLKHGQILKLELPASMPEVQIDPRRTAQVLVNLLSNASKYSPDQTEIVMQAQLEGAQIKVMIIDQGPGILPEYRQNLFHRFIDDKVTNSNNRIRQAGAGLGLSVVKAVVEAQGGQVGIEDAAEGGSIFWFTVPIASQT